MWALATGAGVVSYATRLFDSLDLSTVDRRFELRGPQPTPSDLVVVAVDDVTFDDLRVQWPFPRSLHGRVIDRLHTAGARVIAYDVQFTEETEPSEDDALIDAVARAGNVVLATTEVDERGGSNVFGGDEVVREIGARVGDAILISDRRGIVRRMTYSPQGLESFAIVAAERALGRRIPASALGARSAPIDYRGPPGAIDTVSFSRLLRGQVDPARLRGRIVVVGTSVPSLQDVHPTPTSAADLMSGPEVQANQILTALRGFPLRRMPVGVDVALIALLALVAPAAGLRLGPLLSLGMATAAGALFLVGVQLAFQAGQIASVVYPLGALGLAAVGTLAVHYVREAFERQRVRTLFARFVPEEVVDDVLDCTDDDLRLGARSVTATVLFSDIRGFTSFSETRSPEDVLEVLNVYLSAMTDAIMDNGGTLVSYIGDGILAVFGAPLTQDDHADRALRAARQMLTERLESVNAWMEGEGIADGLRMGVGLHTGPLMSGNIGSERRLDYTVIGDTVNTASRLESMTKGTEHMLMLSQDTRSALLDPPADLVFVDERPVRGRVAPIRVWSLS